METKLDKVLDILNMLEFFYGQRAGRELWADKPVEVQNQDIDNFVEDIKYIKDFLNENVILSKTDYELLTDIKALQLQVQDSLNNMNSEDVARIEKQASKKTAEKIAKYLFSICILEDIPHCMEKYFKKQFGVEIKE